MHRKCQNSRQESRGPFRIWQYSGGTQRTRRTTTQLCAIYTVLPLKVPPLFALCYVKIFSLNQLLFCGDLVMEALSCLFIKQPV